MCCRPQCSQASAGSCSIDDVACFVVASVVGHYPDRNQLLVDAGALALSKDQAPQGGFGGIRGHPELELFGVSQEVGKITSATPIDFERFPIGSRVEILPNHSCLTAACYPCYHVIDSDQGGQAVVARWKPAKFWY